MYNLILLNSIFFSLMLFLFLLISQSVATSVTLYSYNTLGCLDTPFESYTLSLNVCIVDSGSSFKFSSSCASNSTLTHSIYNNNICTDGTIIGIYSLGECIQNSQDGVYVKFICDGCFSKESKVILENKTVIRIDQLKVNDKVLSADVNGNLFYDKVFRIGHYDNDTVYNFIQFTTESGQTIEVSSNHYLYVNQCCDITKLVLALDIKLQSTLYISNLYTGLIYPSKVITIKIIHRRGAYNFHVLSGTIVVNGIVASHFTTESKWNNNAYALLWYSMLNTFLSSK